MKQLSLKNLNLKEVEQLSGEQLKNVLGGYTYGTNTDGGDGGTGGGTECSYDPPNYFCDCGNGKSAGIDKCSSGCGEDTSCLEARCTDYCSNS